MATALLLVLSVASLPLSSDGVESGKPSPSPNLGGNLLFSTFVGGSGNDWAHSVAMAPDGAVYVAGYTTSYDFPTTTGAIQRTPRGQEDVFVLKLSSNGTTLDWATLVGGSGQDIPWDVALGTDGRVYVTGHTESTDFPTTPGAISRQLDGTRDGFVLCLEENGTSLGYSTLLGAEAGDEGHAIWPLTDGTAYVAGHTESILFPTTGGAYDRTRDGFSDAFVARISTDGKGLMASTLLGGGYTEQEPRLHVTTDTVWVTGSTTSQDFPVTPSVYGGSADLGRDIFVTSMDRALGSVHRSTLFGGLGNDVPRWIDVGTEGEVLLSGFTSSPSFPTTRNAVASEPGGETDGFALVLTGDLRELAYSTLLGGKAFDAVRVARFDDRGVLRVAGYTNSTDFPTTPFAYIASKRSDDHDVFYMELHPDGSDGNYSTFVGAGDGDFGMAMALDGIGMPVLAGQSRSPSFPVTTSAYDDSYNGAGDAIVLRFTHDLHPPELLDDASDRGAVTGGTFTFGINATDLTGVAGVEVEFWFDGGAPSLLAMEGDGEFSTTVAVPMSARRLTYRFIAWDLLDRVNRTGDVSIDVQDTVPPWIVLDQTPSEVPYGSTVTFVALMEDNVAMGLVSVELEWDGGADELAMREDPDQPGRYELAPVSFGPHYEGTVRYRFDLMDESGNRNLTQWKVIAFMDLLPPELEITRMPGSALPGTTIHIQVGYNDESAIDSVRLEWRTGPGDPNVENLAVPMASPLDIAIPLPMERQGSLVFTVYMVDVHGNEGSTGGVVPYSDLRPPALLNITLPSEVTTGDPLTVTWQAMDPSGVQSMWGMYGFGEGLSMEDLTYTPSGTAPNASLTIEVPSDSTAPLAILLAAQDPFGQRNETAIMIIPVRDNDPPVARIEGPSKVRWNENVTLDGGRSSDNVGIVKHRWSWYDEELAQTLIVETPGSTLSHRLEPGAHEVTLTVLDAAGNLDTAVLTVTVKAEPVQGFGREVWFYIAIVTGAAIVIALMVLLRKMRTLPRND